MLDKDDNNNNNFKENFLFIYIVSFNSSLSYPSQYVFDIRHRNCAVNMFGG